MAIHGTAIIEGVTLRGPIETCSVGPYAVIGYCYENARAKFYSVNPKTVGKYVDFGARAFVGAHTIISAGTSIGQDSIVEHQCFVGEETMIGERCFIRYGAKLFRRVKVGNDCIVSGFVCNDTIFEDGVVFYGSTLHRFLNRVIGVPEPAPTVREGAYIGYNALLVGGIQIGKGAVIKASAIILKSVPDNHVVEAGDTYRG